MYFIFIFISPSVPRFSVKKSVNQLIKNKRPYVAVENTVQAGDSKYKLYLFLIFENFPTECFQAPLSKW